MANNNSLEDKNVKMLLVVVVVGLVIYLLVSYLNGNGICGNTQEGFHNGEEMKLLHDSLGENHHPLEAEAEAEAEEGTRGSSKGRSQAEAEAEESQAKQGAPRTEVEVHTSLNQYLRKEVRGCDWN